MSNYGWVMDFETLVNPDYTHVWAWGCMSIDDCETFVSGCNIDEFMQYLFTLRKVYTHNLKFDGQFIVDWLLRVGFQHTMEKKLCEGEFSTIISRGGKWYQLSIRSPKGHNVIIRDSLKKLPFSAEKIAKAFNLPMLKGEIDYKLFRSEHHTMTQEEYDYLRTDCHIIASALKIQFDQGLKKMTIGSDAMSWYKEMTGDTFRDYFPKLDDAVDAFIRRSYKGGWTYLHRPGEHGITICLDVNSLYPYAMTMELPVGDPVYFAGEPHASKEYPLYVTHIIADFTLKNDHLPTVQLKGSRFMTAEYVKDSEGPVEMWLTSVDYELFMDHYDVIEIAHIDGYMFKSRVGLFNDYIDYWMHLKETSTGAIRELAKLMLNNLYGKFAKNPDVTRKYPVYEDGKVRLKLYDEERAETVYIPVGSFITAHARNVTIRAAQQNFDRFVYSDTDSLHLIGEELPEGLPIHSTRLGAWDHEYTSTRSRFLRAKRYLTYPGGVQKVTCAGLPKSCVDQVTWDNFVDGAVFSGKLVPKSVPGGVILVDTTFTMD